MLSRPTRFGAFGTVGINSMIKMTVAIKPAMNIGLRASAYAGNEQHPVSSKRETCEYLRTSQKKFGGDVRNIVAIANHGWSIRFAEFAEPVLSTIIGSYCFGIAQRTTERSFGLITELAFTLDSCPIASNTPVSFIENRSRAYSLAVTC
jgi:hypothetical protein